MCDSTNPSPPVTVASNVALDPAIALKVPTEAEAYKFLEDLRWPDGEQVCPHCGSIASTTS